MSAIRELALAFYNVGASILHIYRGPTVGSRLRLAAEYARLRLFSAWHRWKDGDGPSRVRFLGRTLAVRRYDTFVYLVEEIFVHQTYRFESVRPDPVIFDVGSNVGLSVLYFKILYPRARIVAFEPDPESFRLLRANVNLAGLDDVRVENAAAWDSEGTLILRGGDRRAGGVEATVESGTVDSGGSGSGAVADHGVGDSEHGDGGVGSGPGEGAAIRVPAVRLSTFVERIEEEVDLVKMDVEGAEARCLRELRDRSSFASIQEVIVECHHNASDEPLLIQVLDVLEEAGFRYRIRVLDEGATTSPEMFQDVLVHARRSGVVGSGTEERS